MNDIEDLRDALDDAIKRNEALEFALKTARAALEDIEASTDDDQARALAHLALAAMEPKP